MIVICFVKPSFYLPWPQQMRTPFMNAFIAVFRFNDVGPVAWGGNYCGVAGLFDLCAVSFPAKVENSG